jgi:hypothetical protein
MLWLDHADAKTDSAMEHVKSAMIEKISRSIPIASCDGTSRNHLMKLVPPPPCRENFRLLHMHITGAESEKPNEKDPVPLQSSISVSASSC